MFSEIKKECPVTKKEFVISPQEQSLLDTLSPVFSGKKYAISLPKLSPEARMQRRLAIRNEGKLYKNKCQASGKDIISVYSPNKNIVVYDQKEWWSDRWHAKDYAQTIDFNKPFFDQFLSLQTRVPRMNLLQEKNENSQFTNNVSNLKNCYLLFTAGFNERCLYGSWMIHSKDCVDNLMIQECQQCYECWFSKKLFSCKFVFNSSECRDSQFLYDCRNCSNCFFCFGLRNKEYHIKNIAYSKEEYFKKIAEFPLHTFAHAEVCKKEFLAFCKDKTGLFMYRQGKVTDSTGDFLIGTESCTDCYEVSHSRNCISVQGAYDLQNTGHSSYVTGEWGYENCECVPMPSMSISNSNSYGGSRLFYNDMCMNNCSDLFGCVGFHQHEKYGILNHLYSREEYERLAGRLIEHMRSTGEWGEFFPIKNSLYGYNETEAYSYFPVQKEYALQQGWKWQDDIDVIYSGEGYTPQEIHAYDARIVGQETAQANITAILSGVLVCQKTKKPYKITNQELGMYIEQEIAIPRVHPDVRHQARMTHKDPRVLHEAHCESCKTPLQTNRQKVVYCESCYEASVYGE